MVSLSGLWCVECPDGAHATRRPTHARSTSRAADVRRPHRSGEPTGMILIAFEHTCTRVEITLTYRSHSTFRSFIRSPPLECGHTRHRRSASAQPETAHSDASTTALRSRTLNRSRLAVGAAGRMALTQPELFRGRLDLGTYGTWAFFATV